MGFWLGTDGLTQLAIHDGEPCRLIILLGNGSKDKASGGGYCYATDIYDPFGLPIKGNYNGYGSIDNIEQDLNTKLITKWFEDQWNAGNLHLSDRARILDEYEDIIPKGKTAELTIDQILNWIERGYVSLREPDEMTHYKLRDLEQHRNSKDGSKLRQWQVDDYTKLEARVKQFGTDPIIKPFSFMLVMEETFQAAINTVGEAKACEKTNRELNEEKANTYINGLNELLSLGKTPDKGSKMLAELKNLILGGPGMWGFLNTNKFQQNVGQCIVEMMKTGDPGLEAYSKLIVDYRLLLCAMDYSRKGFQPQPGAGSQCDDQRVQLALADTVFKISREREIKSTKEAAEYNGFLRGISYAEEETKKTSEDNVKS